MVRPIILIVALSLIMCVSAMAYTYSVPTNNTATISNYSTEKFDVTATQNVTNDSQYLVLVLNEKAAPTESNIVYINQEAAAENKVTFENVYPKEMLESPDRASETNTYYVYVVGEGRTFNASAPAATFKYYEAEILLGDVDGDTHIYADDASLVLQYVAKIATAHDSTIAAAGDVDNDGHIYADDASYILQYVAKIITTWPNKSSN